MNGHEFYDGTAEVSIISAGTEVTDVPFRQPLFCFRSRPHRAMAGCICRRCVSQKVRPLKKEGDRQDFDIVRTASLTLLGLIIGFSFAMAVNRYDQRKNLEEAEANAIGTEYLRADLLPPEDASRVRDLLRKYCDERISYYLARDELRVGQIDAETAKLQAELWSVVARVAGTQPTPIVGLAVSGMNDVVNAQGYTQAAWWNRIPLLLGF